MKNPLTVCALILLAGGLLLTAGQEARAESLDLVGDTFGAGPVQHDITSTSAVFDNSSLTFTVRFAGGISPASALAARSLAGYIDIDADRNPATGIESAINYFAPGPPLTLGADYFVDLFSEEFLPGRVEVFDDSLSVVGEVPITFGANFFSITVPLALLGGGGGLIDYAVMVGTLDEATDRAPNGRLAPASTPVPEPVTVLLLGTGLTGMGAAVRRWRKTS